MNEIGIKEVQKILMLVFMIMLVAGVAVVINSIMMGVGTESAEAMGVNKTAVYNDSASAFEGTVGTFSNVTSFLPWFGVGLILIGALGLWKHLQFGGN